MVKKIFLFLLVLINVNFIYSLPKYSNNPIYKIINYKFKNNTISIKLLLPLKNSNVNFNRISILNDSCEILGKIRKSKPVTIKENLKIVFVIDNFINENELTILRKNLTLLKDNLLYNYEVKNNIIKINNLMASLKKVEKNNLINLKYLQNYFNKNNSIFIFFGTPQFIQQIHHNLIRDKFNFWVGFITNSEFDFTKYKLKNLLFVHKLKSNLSRIFYDDIDKLNNSYYEVKFKPCNILLKKNKFRIKIFNKDGTETIHFSFNIYPSESNIKSFNKSLIKTSINEYSKQHRYRTALIYLFENKNWFKPSEKLLKKLFTQWANTLIENKGSLPMAQECFDIAEKQYKIKKFWYYSLKKRLLYALLQQEKDVNNKQKILIQLIHIDQNNKKLQFQLYKITGDLAIIKKNKWKAIENYYNAYLIFHNSALQRKLVKLMYPLFEKYDSQKHFTEIYQKGTKFSKILDKSFYLMFFYAKSCEKTLHFNKALKYYQWLYENWQKNEFINWDELIEKLQNSYLDNFKFESAYSFLKRNYRITNNSELLDQAISILRAKYIYAYLIFLKHYLKSNNIDINKIKKILNFNYINYYNYKLLQYFPNNNKNIFIRREQNKINLFFKINARYTLEISVLPNPRTEYESEIINRIQKTPNSEEVWDNLSLYEYIHDDNKGGIKLLSKLIRDLFSINFTKISSDFLTNYNSALKKVNYMKFIVIHGQKGKILSSINFNKSLTIYPKNGWKKSTFSLGYFQQLIRYKNKKIIDIALPVYTNSKWLGVIRFGYIKR